MYNALNLLMHNVVQFEWAWQHPHKSRRLNTLKRKLKSETPVAYRLRVLAAMLRTGKWWQHWWLLV